MRICNHVLFLGFIHLHILWALFHLVRNLCWLLFIWRKDQIFKQHLCCNFAHSISFASFSYSCDDRSGFSYHTKTYQTLCTGQLWTWCHLARPTITRFCPSVVSSKQYHFLTCCLVDQYRLCFLRCHGGL